MVVFSAGGVFYHLRVFSTEMNYTGPNIGTGVDQYWRGVNTGESMNYVRTRQEFHFCEIANFVRELVSIGAAWLKIKVGLT